MEAIAVSPSIGLSCRRSPVHLKPRRSFFPTRFLIGCRLDSSSSFKDGEGPALKAGWRSFRARLVAAENESRSVDSSFSTVDLISPQNALGDKWAHKIYEPEKGCLLLATEKLDGYEIFERTVILLIQVGPKGPSGIILNRRAQEKPRSMAKGTDGGLLNGAVSFGGPVKEGVFLLKTKEALPNNGGVYEEVMEGLYYGLEENLGLASEMVKRAKVEVENFGLFEGYCGWENEDLKEGITAGFWTLAACSASVIESCSGNEFGMWREIHELMGYKKRG